jgi:GMP synthase (glutamine-hydrolysing)
MHETIIILDFGSQVTQLIARRVRELNVYCEIHPWNKIPEMGSNVKGVIFGGSPFSVMEENAPLPDIHSITSKFPVLGICYGAQLIAKLSGGEVIRSTHREYGRANLAQVSETASLMKDVPMNSQVWMSHGDTILNAGPEAEIICSTKDVACAGYRIKGKDIYAVQFHPEVYHSTDGKQVLKNFVIGICGCAGDWTPVSFVGRNSERPQRKAWQ